MASDAEYRIGQRQCPECEHTQTDTVGNRSELAEYESFLVICENCDHPFEKPIRITAADA